MNDISRFGLLVFLLTAAVSQAAQLAGYDASVQDPAPPDEAGPAWRYYGNNPMVCAGDYLLQDNSSSSYCYYATPTSLPSGTFNVGVADYGLSVKLRSLSSISFSGGSDYANTILEWQDDSSYYILTFCQLGVTYGPSGGVLFAVDWSRPHTVYVGYNHGPDTFSIFLDGALMTTVSRATLVRGAQFIGPNQMCFGDATTGGQASKARWYSVGVFNKAIPSPVVVPLVEFSAQRSGAGVSPDMANPPWEAKGAVAMTNNGEVLVQDSTALSPYNGYGNYVSPRIHDLMRAGKGQYGVEFRVRPQTDMLSAGSSYYANLMVVWGDEQDTFRVSIDKNYPNGSPTGALLGNGDAQAKIIDGIDWSQSHTIYIGYSGEEDQFDFYMDNQWKKRVPASELGLNMAFDARFSNRVAFGDFTSGQVAPNNVDLRADWLSVALYDKAAKDSLKAGFDARENGSATPSSVEPAWTRHGTAMTNNGLRLLQDTTALAPANTFGNYVSPKMENLMCAGDSDYTVEFRVKPLSDMLPSASSHYANLMVAWGDNQRTFRVSIDRNYPSAGSATGALLANGNTMTNIVSGIDWSQSRLVQIGYSGDADRFDFSVDGQWKAAMSANALAAGAGLEPSWAQRITFGDYTYGQSAPINVDLMAEWTSIGLRDKLEQDPPVIRYHARRSFAGGTPDLADPSWSRSGAGMVNSGEVLLQDTTSFAPGNTYGNYVSQKAVNLMKAGTGEYGVEFRVRPLSDMPASASSCYANLMVAWGDDQRSYGISIDRNYPGPSSSTGALLGNGNTMTNLVDGIDWSQPHTVYIGYTGSADQFDISVDGQWRKTIPAASLAAGLAYAPSWSERVAFGDFTSGQTAPYNVDLKAEWSFVGIYDRKNKSLPRAEDPEGTLLVPFSQIGSTHQQAIRAALAPPPLSARNNPYAGAMYYPMWGLTNAGVPVSGSSPDGQYHPEWQQALIQDWAALGMKNLHVDVFPDGTGTETRSYVLAEADRVGLANVGALAAQYGMRVILRADPPMAQNGYWPANPRNSSNELAGYLSWLEAVLNAFGGQVYAIIPGDEIAENSHVAGQEWTLEDFRQYVIRVADAVHQGHPQIKVSTPSFGAGSWGSVLGLFTGSNGLGGHANALAINLEDTAVATQYAADLKANTATANLGFFANGVGYISSSAPRNPNWETGYYPYNDPDQAGLIACSMYHSWAAGMGNSPYYVPVRNIVYHGTVNPMYYGFFGFMDLNIASNNQASVTHYPAWNAFQTVATAFYDVSAFKRPDFPIRSTGKRTAFFAGHERMDGNELLLFVLGDGITNIEIESDRFTVPVWVDLLNKDNWQDIQATQSGKRVTLWDVPLQGQRIPVIIRVISKDL